MPFWKTAGHETSNQVQLADAVQRVAAVTWYTPEGEILDANDTFCAAMGYTRDEILGRKHALFVAPQYAESQEYRGFWDRLGKGACLSDTFQTFGKDGRPVWIEASFVPITNPTGTVTRIVEIASDVTARIEAAAWWGCPPVSPISTR